MLISWADGLEESPSGAPLREVAQPNVWSSSVWIAPDGSEVWRRYHNAHAQTWTWEAMVCSLDREQNRLGILMPTGWMSLATAVATAFLHRAPDSRAPVRVLGGPVDVRSLMWGEPERVEDGRPIAGETWKPLQWWCGTARCNEAYQISSHGRLRSPSGEVTSGFAAHGARWAAVCDAGLVNLSQASGLADAEVKLPPRVHHAYRALMAGVHPEVHAARVDIKTKQAWTYYTDAARYVPLARGKAIVDEDLWAALMGLRGHEVLGGKLTELHAAVSAQLGRDASFEELRFARTLVASD